MKIFVGEISKDVNNEELRKLFEAFGFVKSIIIIIDKYTGESRGFGYVHMPDKEEANTVIRVLNGKRIGGRILQVNEARTRLKGTPGVDRRQRIYGIKNPGNIIVADIN